MTTSNKVLFALLAASVISNAVVIIACARWQAKHLRDWNHELKQQEPGYVNPAYPLPPHYFDPSQDR